MISLSNIIYKNQNVRINNTSDRFWLYASFTCVVIASTFAVSVILGKVIFVALPVIDFSQVTVNDKAYPDVVWAIFKVIMSGFFIFITPVFFSTILSVMPKPKIFITPAISQIIVFCLLVMYLVFNQPSEQHIFLIVFAVIPFMIMPIVQHKIVKDLVGVNLEQVVRYSLKIKGVTLDDVFDMLMDPNNRDELGLSEKTIQTTKKMEIIGKNMSRSLRIGLKERDDHILLNVIFYRLEINNFITNDVHHMQKCDLGTSKKSSQILIHQ